MRQTHLCKTAGHHDPNTLQPLNQAHSLGKPPTSTPPFLFLLTPKAATGKLALVVQENKVPGIYYYGQNEGFLPAVPK